MLLIKTREEVQPKKLLSCWDELILQCKSLREQESVCTLLIYSCLFMCKRF